MKSARATRIITSLSIGVIALSAISWIGLGQITGSLKRVDAFAGLNSRPEKASSAVNYLLVGSDNRAGLTAAELKTLRVGSKARDKAVIVSLPRDTLVTVPQYVASNGKTIAAQQAKLNSAFSWGGAPLLIQVVEAKTNLRIDHYVEIGFGGFAKVVDSLGGIQVCSKVAINDPKSHLVMTAGIHTLNGIEALKYIRTRDFDGMGDLGRMQRQQQFMSSVIKKATSTGVLLNPVKFISFINAAMETV